MPRALTLSTSILVGSFFPVAYMVKSGEMSDFGGEMSDFGGGQLEHPRPRLAPQWPEPTLGVPSCTGPPGAPRGGAGGEPGTAEKGALCPRCEAGEVSLVLSQASMADRSYVCPSIVKTGSLISSCVIGQMSDEAMPSSTCVAT